MSSNGLSMILMPLILGGLFIRIAGTGQTGLARFRSYAEDCYVSIAVRHLRARMSLRLPTST